MIGSRPAHRPDDLPADNVPRKRGCLSCSLPFQSQWAGERICKRCKSSAVWRDGTRTRTHPAKSK